MEAKTAEVTNVLDECTEVSRILESPRTQDITPRTQESPRGRRRHRRSRKAKKHNGDTVAAPGSSDKGTRDSDIREHSAATVTDKSSSSKHDSTEKTTNAEEAKKGIRDNSLQVQQRQGAAEGAQNTEKDRAALQAQSSSVTGGTAEASRTKAGESAPRGDVAETPEARSQRYRFLSDVNKTVALTAGLIIVIFFIIIGPNGPNPVGYVTCDTDGCSLYAQKLRASLNASASDPCYNFKEFVCDGWRRRNTYSVRQNMTVTALDVLADLAHSVNVPTKGQTTAQKGAGFFRSCDAVLRNDKDDMAVVKKLLREAKIEWPRRPAEPDVLHTLFYSSIRLRWSPIFNIEIETTKTYATRVFLMPYEDFDLVARKYISLKKSEAAERRAYFDVLGDEFGAAAADQTVVSFEEVENTLQVMLDPLLDAMLKEERKPLAISTAWLYRPGADPSKARWQSVLASYGVEGNETIIYETEALSFVMEFFNLWARYGEAMTEILVSWCTVQVAALYTNQRLVTNYYGTQDATRFQYGAFCLSKAYLIAGFSVFAPYVHEEMKPSARGDAEVIALSVRRAFLTRLMAWKHYEPERIVLGDWDSVSVVFSPFDSDTTSISNGNLSYPDMGESLAENWRDAAVPLDIIRSDMVYVALKSLKLHVVLDHDFLLLPFATAFPNYHPTVHKAIKYAGVGKEVALALSEAFLDTYARFNEAKRAIDSASICMAGAPDFVSNMEAIALSALFDAFRNALDGKDIRLGAV
ncbi:endothelin-converting enzyme 2 [Dermacentor silvarum]|uniref:endothelin-converting enzyme 2 n=1 Tax=Dermacentor silvarum TaxID=543639 RepID=UPI001899DDBA|nr:endothelin-converting enzyme 2 [Dermacentor silvarum]